uniref:enhancer of mRNA-decapping protein 4 isoform X2 n=1 Tax=Myxine glutinosa TaxID=7769 RepID=UPI00358F5706
MALVPMTVRRSGRCELHIPPAERSLSCNGQMNGAVGTPSSSGETVKSLGFMGESKDESRLIASPPSMATDLVETQEIKLSGDDGVSPIIIRSRDVVIVPSVASDLQSPSSGSNRVKVQTVTKYDWERKFYPGSLVAVSQDYLAYIIPKPQAMVRVLHTPTAERTLLKGFMGAVTDIAFAYPMTTRHSSIRTASPRLAALDDAGGLFVWNFKIDSSGKMHADILVQIVRPLGTPPCDSRRIVWCPHNPDDEVDVDAEADPGKMLALLHPDRAEVWDLEVLIGEGTNSLIQATDVSDGLVTIRGHNGAVLAGCLSPDGAVLATAGQDGMVKFWQVYLEGQETPRCLHKWSPHHGYPVCSLIFCDDHYREDSEVPFWRFVLTGMEENREIKLWCTVRWTCLQTLQFSPDSAIKASLDFSAQYLLLSDTNRKVLYILELSQSIEDGWACFHSLSEFLLTQPLLGLGIADVTPHRSRNLSGNNGDVPSNDGDGSEETLAAGGVLIKLTSINPRALENVQVLFLRPSESHGGHLPNYDICSKDGFALRDLGDVPRDLTLGGGDATGPYQPCSSELGLTQMRMSPSRPPPPILDGANCSKQTSGDPDGAAGGTVCNELARPEDFVSFMVASGEGLEEEKPQLKTPEDFRKSAGAMVGGQIPASPTLVCSAIGSLMAHGTAAAATTTTTTTPQTTTPDQSFLPGVSQAPIVSSTSVSLPTTLLSPVTLATIHQSLPSQSLLPALPLVDLGSTPTHPSPLHAHRSPDVISSASSTPGMQHPSAIPEVASEALRRGLRDQPRPNLMEQQVPLQPALRLSCAGHEGSATPSLLLESLTGRDASGTGAGWPTAPDLTRETPGGAKASSDEDFLMDRRRFPSRRGHPAQVSSSDSRSDYSDPDEEIEFLSSPADANPVVRRLPAQPGHRETKGRASPRGSPRARRSGQHEDGNKGSRVVDQEALRIALTDLQRQQEELRVDLRGRREAEERGENRFNALQNALMGHIDSTVSEHSQRQRDWLEQRLAEISDRMCQYKEQLVQNLGQTLVPALGGRIDRVVREEMKKTVAPGLSKALEPVASQLNSSLTSKLSSVEGTLKETVTRVVKSKGTGEAIGKAAGEALQVPLTAVYTEAISSTLIPAVERTCQVMFQQLDATFQQGTADYKLQLESVLLQRRQREDDSLEGTAAQIAKATAGLKAATGQLTSNLVSALQAEVQTQMRDIVASLQEAVCGKVRSAVREQLEEGLKEQQQFVANSIVHAVRSAAGTPVPSSQPVQDIQVQQAQLLHLLHQGRINQAFQQALTAADLNLVLYLCTTTDPQQVFISGSCLLEQPVLLSLIQQLSTDLGLHTQIKLRFLEEAVMALDRSHPLTREHSPGVLVSLQQKIYAFMQAQPQGMYARTARLLLMAVQSLTRSC